MVLIGYWNAGHMGYVSGSTTKIWWNAPDSVGSVDICLTFRNNSDKVIKYVYFTFVPTNAVGDLVRCSVRGNIEARLECVGPVQPGEERSAHWENVWYNKSITTTALFNVEIEYMDGTTESIVGKDVKIETPPLPAPDADGGCYVATAVYRSYDCPQVWTLRRFRDNTLAEHWYGRAFVWLYYAVSPTLVRWFGNTPWFQKLWRGPLDRLVARLQAKGVDDSPYEDKPW